MYICLYVYIYLYIYIYIYIARLPGGVAAAPAAARPRALVGEVASNINNNLKYKYNLRRLNLNKNIIQC